MDFVGYLGKNFIFLILLVFFILTMTLPTILNWYKQYKNRKIMVRSGIRDIDRMSGFDFENYLVALFTELGYKPVQTPKSGDFGADVILQGKNKVVIQAKRYGYKNNVSLDAIREVYASKAYYKADEAWVITNSFFTKQARVLAKACNVKLLDRYELQKFIIEVNPKHKGDKGGMTKCGKKEG